MLAASLESSICLLGYAQTILIMYARIIGLAITERLLAESLSFVLHYVPHRRILLYPSKGQPSRYVRQCTAAIKVESGPSNPSTTHDLLEEISEKSQPFRAVVSAYERLAFGCRQVLSGDCKRHHERYSDFCRGDWWTEAVSCHHV